MSSDTQSPQANPPTNTKGRRLRIPLLLVALCLTISLGTLAYANRQLLNEQIQDFFSGPPAVGLTHTVESGNLRVTVTEQGTVESSENTEVKCRVRGFSTVISIVEAGTEVNAGDELVRLDTKRVEDAISKHTTESHTARATLERSIADLKQAELAEQAYIEGEYKTQLQRLERELKVAQTNLQTAEKMLIKSRSMFNRGYVTRLEVEGNGFTVTQAKLELEVKQTQLNVLEKYTNQMRLETIHGNLAAAKSKKQADESGLAMDEGRRDRAKQELALCVIKAEKDGMVIYPSAAAWKDTPDVTEGATVRRDQTLLLMPDLSKMQVKVGIHESMIEKVHIGMSADVTLADVKVQGKVSSVASVAQPAGWWTGNVVKYDVIVDVPASEDLKPGMTAEVDLLLSESKNVLSIPVSSIIETDGGFFCWVKKQETFERVPILLGEGNEIFVVVEKGLQLNDEVALNPQAFLIDANNDMKQISGSKQALEESENVR